MTFPPVQGARAGTLRLVVLLALAASIGTSACGWLGGASVTPLAHTHESPESLARAVLDALAANDRVALHALALSEREFRDHVWPGLPAARPERNLPFDFVWGDLSQKSEQYLATTLADLGGKRLSLVGVRFTGDTTDYGTCRVHRKSLLTVRDAAGAERHVRAFGSVVEQAGRFKVFSYVVD